MTNVWDAKTQTFHGGQEHRFLNNFVEDFSVTTNYLGTPRKAAEAAREAINDIHHYPAADQEPSKTRLAEFLWGTDASNHRCRLLLGNGASELIDLVVRKAFQRATEKKTTAQPTWKGGPSDVQYQEYQRSAKTNGFQILPSREEAKADMLCIVNPCNPTGDYLDINQLKKCIRENTMPGGTVIVDESMQPWHSEDFRSDSLTTQHAFVQEMWDRHTIAIHVMHSWTKIWSCTGLRLGSVVCPTAQHCEALRKIQVPWSVNGPALKFLEAVVSDTDYLKMTWENTTRLRQSLLEKLKHFPGTTAWQFYGKPFLSWVWIQMDDDAQAERAVCLAREAGVPVRSGAPGYNCHRFVRVAVREESKVDVLLHAWSPLLTRGTDNENSPKLE